MACPGVDELPADKGCQVSCKPEQPGAAHVCARARAKCESLRSCKSFNVNDEGTWATLKQHLVKNGAGTSVAGLTDAYCPPALKERSLQTGDALCPHACSASA
eukprot:scaffold84219_cov34-Tisochrysis_lutea.AAC.1